MIIIIKIIVAIIISSSSVISLTISCEHSSFIGRSEMSVHFDGSQQLHGVVPPMSAVLLEGAPGRPVLQHIGAADETQS